MQEGPGRVAMGSDCSVGGVGVGKPLGAPMATRVQWSALHLCPHELRCSRLPPRTPLGVGVGAKRGL